MKELTYAKYQSRIVHLVDSVRNVLHELPEEQYGHIRDASLAELADLETDEPLTIAIVGQYSAGKSTITKALTGRDDIEIGQGVTTSSPNVYHWKGLRIVDTPGIKADRPEHDEMSLRYIDRAHLLVFVSTISGFDSLIGETFRELAIERERAGKMMLTLNKRQMESGGNEQGWIESLKPVIQPLTVNDVRLTIIDAQEYLEAQNDEEFGDELRQLSHFDEFVKQLNDLIRDRKLNGRLLASLNVIETTVDNALKQVGATSEETQLIQEHLRRNSVAIRESRAKIERKIDEVAREVETAVLKKGRELASKVTVDADVQNLQDDAMLTAGEIKSKCREANRKIERFVVNEVNRLEDELSDLANSSLVHEIRVRTEVDDTEISIDDVKDRRVSLPDSTRDVIGNVGNFLRARSVADAGKAGLKAVGGSDVHAVIKNVGHWIGYKFKPWEAVKMADKVGKAGKFAGKLGTLLGPALDFWNWRAAKKKEEKMQEISDSVRNGYRQAAEQISESYDQIQDKVFSELHDPALEALQNDSDELMKLQGQKNQTAEKLKEFRSEARKLIGELQE